MKPLTPYMFFDGNAREAMEFYKECFGGTAGRDDLCRCPRGRVPRWHKAGG